MGFFLMSLLLFGGCLFDNYGCDEDNLLTMSAPANVSEFRVFDSKGSVLWEVRASPPVPLSAIRYAVSPSGSLQTVPAEGKPRPLVSGEQILTETLTDSRYMVHRGHATGPAGFCGGAYQSGPLSSWDKRQLRPAAAN